MAKDNLTIEKFTTYNYYEDLQILEVNINLDFHFNDL